MKYLSTTVFLTLCHIAFAQTDLYISDNANVYVYVDGAAFTSGTNASLYVTNGINLVGDGNLYLRNEAQLIQNNPTANNSGTGRLSVYQTGTSNTYMYNYWCSPVGQNTVAAGNTDFMPSNNFYYEDPGPITSSLFGYTTGYDGTTTEISEYWLYRFTGITPAPNEYQDWIGLGGGSIPVGGNRNGTLEPGYGFTMKGNPSASQKYDFRGRPNNGTIGVHVNANLETLVGNPYPSAIDTVEFLHGSTANNQAVLEGTGTLSFWEQDLAGSTSHVLTNYRGGYATYTIDAGGGTETYTPATFDSYNPDGTLNTTGGNSTGKFVRRYIPIGQGFMIRGNGTGGTVEFTNSMRSFQKESDGNSEFFRTTSGSSNFDESASYTEDGLFIVPEDYKRFRLNLDFNETYTRQLLLNFHHTATPGEDYGLETLSPEALESDAFWPQGTKAYNAQAFSFDVGLRIPMVIDINQNQPFRFRIFDVQNFDEDQPIFIHDIQNGVYVNLRENNYEINLPQGTYTDRFEITFTADALNIDQVVTIDDLNIYQNNQLAQLNIANPKLLDIKQVRLYEVSGKQIFNERNLNKEANYSFSTKNLSQGVYIASVTFTNNQVISKKVVVSNK
ncbi:MAG TPA: T9SS type A sorting domain-containing protein [Xanthomarina sp.]|nr:T9SS type A sorting domain-containing protein [Xanthomarina sp.]